MKKPKTEVTPTTAQTAQNAPHSKAEQDRRIESASLLTRPSLNSAAVMVAYGEPLGMGEDDVGAMMVALGNSLGEVLAGDLRGAEATLFCRANVPPIWTLPEAFQSDTTIQAGYLAGLIATIASSIAGTR